MQRIDVPTAVAVLPTPDAAGTPGYWGKGDPSTSTPATILDRDFFNMLQEELMAIVAAGGLTGSKTTYTQVRDAIRTMIQAQTGNYALDTGAANAYVATYTPAIAAYTNGMTLRFKAAHANTGASTFNAGPAAKALVDDDGDPLVPNAITVNAIVEVVYDSVADKIFVTSIIPSVALIGAGAVEQLLITNNATTPNTKIDVSHGPISLVSSSGTPIWFASGSATIDLTTTGVNAMDTGARPTSGWLYVHAVSNGTLLKYVASTSATAPTMPGGYVYRKYLGAMRCDGSQNLMRTKQIGRNAQYVITAATNTAGMPQIATGLSGTLSGPSATWSGASTANFAPPTASEINVECLGDGACGFMAMAPNNQYAGYSSASPPPYKNDNNSASIWPSLTGKMVLETANVYGANNVGTFALYCLGWTDYYL